MIYESIVELLCQHQNEYPDQLAFTFLADNQSEESRWSYNELLQRTCIVAGYLQTLRVSGQRAILIYQPGLDFISAFLGCLYSCVIPVPIYPPRRSPSLERLQAIINDAEATIALTSVVTYSKYGNRISEISVLAGLRWICTDELNENYEFEWKMPEISGNMSAFLQYTSGSTSAPKGVIITHQNLLANSEAICQAFEHTQESKGVIWLPPYHDMGLIGGIIQNLYAGCHCILMSPMTFLKRPLSWLQTISKYRATTSGGPNFSYELVVRKMTPSQCQMLDLSSWRVAFSGAEPIDPDTIKRFIAAFEPYGFNAEAMYPCYGLAESTLIVSGGSVSKEPIISTYNVDALDQQKVAEIALPHDRKRKLVGCGTAVNGMDILIVDPVTKLVCPEKNIGEIWLFGSSVGKGYRRNLKENEIIFHAKLADQCDNEYLRTGDLGFFDNDELFVTGRLKDLIIIQGRNYYPQDLERTVGNCHESLIPECGAAFGLRDDGQDRLIIIQEVERTSIRNFNDDDIIININKAVVRNHEIRVHDTVFIMPGTIPRTSSGKIRRNECRMQYLDGRLRSIRNRQTDQG